MQVVLLAGGLGSHLTEETVRIPKPMMWVARRGRCTEICSHPRGRADIVNRARFTSCPLFFRGSRKSHLGSYCLFLELCVGKDLGFSMRFNRFKGNEAARQAYWPPEWRPLHHDPQYEKAGKIGDLNKQILLTISAPFYSFVSNSSPTSQVTKNHVRDKRFH